MAAADDGVREVGGVDFPDMAADGVGVAIAVVPRPARSEIDVDAAGRVVVADADRAAVVRGYVERIVAGPAVNLHPLPFTKPQVEDVGVVRAVDSETTSFQGLGDVHDGVGTGRPLVDRGAVRGAVERNRDTAGPERSRRTIEVPVGERLIGPVAAGRVVDPVVAARAIDVVFNAAAEGDRVIASTTGHTFDV